MFDFFSNIQKYYNVNVYVFVVIFFLSIIPFWLSFFKIISNLRRRNFKRAFYWIIILSLVYFAPYLYIYLFGENFPLWFHFVFWGLILVLIYTLIKKIANKLNTIKTNQGINNWRDFFFWDLYSFPYNKLITFSIPHQELYNDIYQNLNFERDKYILDAGCGGGHLENFFTKKGIGDAKIEAIDFSEKMLKDARTRCQGFSRINFNQLDLNKKLPYIDNSFDVIICISVLFALSSQEIFEEFYRILKPEGKLILVEPKPDFDGRKLWRSQKMGLRKLKYKAIKIYPLIPLIIFLNKVIDLKQRGGNYQQFSLNGLKEILDRIGFKIKITKPVLADQDWFIMAVKKDSIN